MPSDWGVLAVVAVALVTIYLGGVALRLSRTTSDFYVASRTVSPLLNASAIGGEYLSAASFLGVAGLVLARGADMLWYPVGYTAGYLVLLVLVAAPLRRSGAYTLPDFAEARLESRAVRHASTVLVVVIGWLYLVPQLQGAGLTLQTVSGAPTWAGGLVVCSVVLVSVLAGGMRSITFAQAFQFWLKLTAISLPAVVVLLLWHGDGSPSVTADTHPRTREQVTVTIPSNETVTAPETVTVTARGRVDGRPADGPVTLVAGAHQLSRGTTVVLPAGTTVPVVSSLPATTNLQWSLTSGGSGEHPLYATYSLILATFLGTMGLPHVLVRFYTNPDGRDARRTTRLVIVLLACFYVVPPVLGALSRLYAPDLLMTGRTDTAVLLLPTRLLPGLPGELLSALVTAGAFAAFLSTSSGLVVSVSGVISQSLPSSERRPVATFRLAAVAAVVVPFVLALGGAHLALAALVGLAFAVAASSFCPLLVLGVWWRRLTDVGALAGLAVGGGLAGGAVVVTVLTGAQPGWVGALLEQPAAWSVPAAFLTMVVVSLATPHRQAPHVARTMVRLHLPDSLDVDRGDWRPRLDRPSAVVDRSSPQRRRSTTRSTG